jgi:hypothetical protein
MLHRITSTNDAQMFNVHALFIFLQMPIAGNLTVETYDLPTAPVSKPPCTPPTDGNSIACLQDGVVTRINVSEALVNTPLTYTYTFCKYPICVFAC